MSGLLARFARTGAALVAFAACTPTPLLPRLPERPAAPSERDRLASSVFPDDEAPIKECAGHDDERDFVGCLLERRFLDDPQSAAIARKLYAEHGIVAGMEAARVMDDGDYRGRVEVAPALPVAENRKHLEWILEAFTSLTAAFDDLAGRARAPLRFVRKPSAIRFFETVNTTTPSAYAIDDVIYYNLKGELWTSADDVIDTLVHELFHLTDARHERWSERAIRETYETIRSQCDGDQTCLERFAPHETKVDGGIFYAFHPTSDVREYVAELAARFVREQRQALGSSPAAALPFKCQAEENERVWRSFADEFFGGLDLVPPC